ncbi:DNA replication regulator SLD3-domain-containing protein [Phyllosticta citribraziliensis]|uniref:DNA replication regulator SLD3-domain-containing protein n=1 Tax=Phyllosticta citribraziliensis TaxID=989973 RepID=A0ABR1LKY2_9PEZI
MVSAHEQSIYTKAAQNPPLAKTAAAGARDAATSTRQPGTTAHSLDSRKRKRGQESSAAFAQRAITIRPCPTAPLDRPTILTPLVVIQRAQLPLSCLDLSPPTPGSARLFSAHIEALEPKPLGEDATARENGAGFESPKVLITRLQGSTTLFAVERVRRGVYALCKLGHWVKVEDLEQASARTRPQSQYANPKKALNYGNGGAWWAGAAIADQQPDIKVGKRTERAPRLSMGRPKPNALSKEVQNAPVDDPFVETQPQDPFAESMAVDGPDSQLERPQTAEEVFQALVQQYLDMLYLSKTSLAFFVKGPLSRARAAFTSNDGNGTLKVGELAAFFRSILLQLGQVDKKYREKIPDIVKELPLPGFSDDEDTAAAQRPEKKKKGRSKKMKPNKEGMYPGEDEYVKQWWIRDFPSSPGSHPEESSQDMFKRKVGDLRVRESMAQLVLVLEILALEASPGFQAVDQDETQQETQVDSQQPEKKRRKKKLQDLHVLLDLLLDKLCIWQSVEQDEMLVKISKSGQGGTAAAETPNSTKAGTSDKLRSFCVEVIIPFYMGRLPEKAAAINKRLGGPSASPSKATTSSSSRSKPGEATTRTDPRSAQRRRKPLQRVATENATRPPSRAPSLSRSATDSAIAGPVFKRESSEVSLSSIPLKSAPPPSSRNSLSQFQRFAKREIDLQEMSAATEAKIKKKERIARELKEAISTLSKPNRASAVKEYADSTDRKMLAGSTRPGLTKKSAVKSTTSGRLKEADKVQVGATPKKPRRTSDHLVDATPTHNRSYVVDPRDQTTHQLAGTFMHFDNPFAVPPPSSDTVVPSSAVRPSAVPPHLMDSSRSSLSATSAPFHSSLSESTSRLDNPFPPPPHHAASAASTAMPAVLATPSRPKAKPKSVSFAATSASDVSAPVATPPPSYISSPQPHHQRPHPPIPSFADRLVGRVGVGAGSSSSAHQPFKLPPLPPAPLGASAASSSGGVVFATPTKPKMTAAAAAGRDTTAGRGGVLREIRDSEDEDEEDEGDEVDVVGVNGGGSGGGGTSMATGHAAVVETPVKSGLSGRAEVRHFGGVVEEVEEVEEEARGDVDVYKALGWDDDDDLL